MTIAETTRPAGFRSKFSADEAQSYTLPAHYYYDPAIREREGEEIWFKSWLPVGYLSDLANPGDYITAKILDQLVFVIRGKDQTLRAYYNVCMHRGHVLLEGKGNRRMITCPFHAWTYDLDGSLKAAGNAENVVDFDHADFSLAAVRVEEFLNMVFVNFDPDAATLDSQAGDLAAMVRSVLPNLDDLKRVRRDVYEINGNWSVDIIEGQDELLERMHKVLPFDVGPESMVKDVHIWFLWPSLLLMAHQGPANFKLAQVWPTGAESMIRTIDHFVLNDPPTEHEFAQMDNEHVGAAGPRRHRKAAGGFARPGLHPRPADGRCRPHLAQRTWRALLR